MKHEVTNLSLALSLAQAGLPVFPCTEAAGLAYNAKGEPKKEKAPYTSAGFKDATTDPAKIQSWWAEWPGAVPAIPTGEASGLSVIDGDIDRDTGEAVGERQVGDLGLTHPDAVTVRTQSGGVQIIYKHVEGARTSSHQVASHIDTRGSGGYIVAPGARMQDGATYRYEGRTLSEAIKAGNLPAYPVAAVQGALARRREAKLSDQARAQSDTGGASATTSETLEIVRTLLAEAPNTLCREDWVKLAVSLRVEYGNALRDDFTSYSLRYAGPTPCTEADAAHVWQSSHAAHTVTGIGPALALLKAEAGPELWKRAYREVLGARDDISSIHAMFDGQQGRTQDQDKAEAKSETPGPVLQDSAAFCAAREPADYLIDGSVRDGWLYTLTAPTGHGKSAVALAIAYAVAKGGFLGSREVKQGSVLFLAGENADDIRERWIAMCEKNGDDPASLPVTFMPGVWDLKGCLPMLRDRFKDNPLRLVVVDTLAAFFNGDNENDNAQQQEFATRVLRPLTELPGRPTGLVPAHPTKGAGKDSLTPKGGSSLLNAVDGNMTAWNTDGTVKVHWQGKFRGAPWLPMHFELTEHLSSKLMDSRGRIMPTVTARAMLDSEIAKATERGVKVENQVLKLLNDGLTVREIADDVIADGQRGISKSRVDRVIQRLAEQKWIAKNGRAWALTSQGWEVLKQAGEDIDPDA